MITFNTLLRSAGIGPRSTLVLRNVEQELRSFLPWLALECPDLFRAYQHTQSPGLEKAMLSATHLASFIGHEPGRAVFVQTYAIGAHRRLTADEFWALPEHQELRQLGYRGIEPDQTKLAFDLVPQPELSNWHGKLIIDWTGREVGWWRWASRNEFPVRAILEESGSSGTCLPGMSSSSPGKNSAFFPAPGVPRFLRGAGSISRRALPLMCGDGCGSGVK